MEHPRYNDEGDNHDKHHKATVGTRNSAENRGIGLVKGEMRKRQEARIIRSIQDVCGDTKPTTKGIIEHLGPCCDVNKNQSR